MILLIIEYKYYDKSTQFLETIEGNYLFELFKTFLVFSLSSLLLMSSSGCSSN